MNNPINTVSTCVLLDLAVYGAVRSPFDRQLFLNGFKHGWERTTDSLRYEWVRSHMRHEYHVSLMRKHVDTIFDTIVEHIKNRWVR